MLKKANDLDRLDKESPIYSTPNTSQVLISSPMTPYAPPPPNNYYPNNYPGQQPPHNHYYGHATEVYAAQPQYSAPPVSYNGPVVEAQPVHF